MKFTELTNYLNLLQSLGLKTQESGLKEVESTFSLPYSHLESLANLALALRYAPRAEGEPVLKRLPKTSITAVGNNSFELAVADFPDKKHDHFTLVVANSLKSQFGVSIAPDTNTPGKIKTAIFTLDHFPLPARLRPRLAIADSSLLISGIGHSPTEATHESGELVTLESLQEKLRQITLTVQKDRPNFHLDVVGTKNGETPIIVLVQTDGVFSGVKINLVKDDTSMYGYKTNSQAFVNDRARFIDNPHAAEVTRRLESSINYLFLPLLYPNIK